MTAERIDVIAALAALSEEERGPLIRELPLPVRRELAERWDGGWAQAGQVAPAGDDWRIWLIRAGRGFGKTRAGAEWVTAIAAAQKDAQIALVGATEADVRRVMIEGPSGLRAVAKTGQTPRYTMSRGEVRWPNGAVARVYSADVPDQLRGPEHDAAWCDELAKWRRGDAAGDNLMMGLRRGAHPRVLVTTTPRPTNLMKRVMRSRGLVETWGRTRDNPFLPDAFVDHVEDSYAGTALGRQELVFTGSAAETRIKTSALSGVLDDYRLSFESGDSMTGRFLVTRLDYAGDFNGERSYTLSLESSGPVVVA